MDITFQNYQPEDAGFLIEWLSTESWPYHVIRQPDPDSIKTWIDEGKFNGKDVQSLWIVSDKHEKIGLLRIQEIDSPEPVFDLRLRSQARGQGIGKQAVTWMCKHVFTTMPHIRRCGGYTREDNIAMRKTFRYSGFVKEAHYRKSWPDEAGNYLDSIYYGLTKDDWSEKKVTPVNWYDE